MINTCAACGGQLAPKGKCKDVSGINGSKHICFNKDSASDNPVIAGWRFKNLARNGMGGVWVEPGYKSEYSGNPLKPVSQVQTQKEVKEDTTQYTDKQLNENYRLFLAQTTLSFQHQTLLKKRGISDIRFFIKAGFRSFVTRTRIEHTENVPGLENGLVKGNNGIFLPTLTPWGDLISGQIAPDSKRLGKYVYIKNAIKARLNGYPLSFAYAFPEFAQTASQPVVTLEVIQETNQTDTCITTRATDSLGVVLECCSKVFKPLSPDAAQQQGLLLGLQSVLKIGATMLSIKGVGETVQGQLKHTQANNRVETIARLNRELLAQQVEYVYSSEPVSSSVDRGEVARKTGDQYLDTKTVYFVDGTAKAWYTAHKHKVAVIGAPACNHPSNLEDLKKYLVALSAETCIHAPDAGDMVNTSTIPGLNRKLHQTLQDLGYLVKVAWWGQREKVSGNDIDDQADLDIEFITPDEFMLMHDPKIRAAMDKSQFAKPGIQQVSEPYPYPRDIKYRTPLEFAEGQRLALLQSILSTPGQKFAHDKSPAGSGKSFDYSTWFPQDFGKSQLLWLVNDAVNFEYPEWTFYRGRDYGRKVRQSDGRIVAAKSTDDTDELILQPNCVSAAKAEFLADKNIIPDSRVLCATCAIEHDCKSSQGFYHFDRKKAQLADRVRMHPSALDTNFFKAGNGKPWGKTEDKTPGTIIIMDDVAPWDKAINVTAKQIGDFIDHHEIRFSALPTLRNALVILRSLLKKKDDLIQNEILDVLPDLNNLDEEALKRLLYDEQHRVVDAFEDHDLQTDTIAPSWIEDLLKGIKDGVLHTYKGVLTITLKNARFLEALAHPAVAHVILGDATAKTEDFEKWVKATEPITSIAQELPEKQGRLNITQVVGLGDLGYNRSAHTQKKLTEFKARAKTAYKNHVAIELKKNVSDDDDITNLVWRSSSRGSNAAKEFNTIICYGTPRANLASLRAKYMLMTGQYPDTTSTLTPYPVQYINQPAHWIRVLKESKDQAFAEFCHQEVTAELTQGFNRLRHIRRPGETLDLIFVSEYPLELPVKALSASEMMKDTSEQKQSTLGQAKCLTDDAVVKAGMWLKENGFRITYAAVAKLCDVNSHQVAYFFDQPGYDWKQFKMAETLINWVFCKNKTEFSQNLEKNNINNKVIPSLKIAECPVYKDHSPPFNPVHPSKPNPETSVNSGTPSATPKPVYFTFRPRQG